MKIVAFDGQPEEQAIKDRKISQTLFSFPTKSEQKQSELIMSYFNGEEVAEY